MIVTVCVLGHDDILSAQCPEPDMIQTESTVVGKLQIRFVKTSRDFVTVRACRCLLCLCQT